RHIAVHTETAMEKSTVWWDVSRRPDNDRFEPTILTSSNALPVALRAAGTFLKDSPVGHTSMWHSSAQHTSLRFQRNPHAYRACFNGFALVERRIRGFTPRRSQLFRCGWTVADRTGSSSRRKA